ncbi:NUDIX hydrolase [Chloroflexota bacterium]
MKTNIKQPKKGVIQAAGGLVWRRNKGVTEIVLVHRPRFDDWTLPKGKLQKKETFQQAALREVQEETGCQAHLVSLAGSTCYVAFGWPKVVLFWNMILLEQNDFEPNAEVDIVVWLAADRAAARLSYGKERIIVENNLGFWESQEYI